MCLVHFLQESVAFICLWHIKKSWAENVVKKINDKVEEVVVLQRIGFVMYMKDCPIDYDPVLWAHEQLHNTQCNHPKVCNIHEIYEWSLYR